MPKANHDNHANMHNSLKIALGPSKILIYTFWKQLNTHHIDCCDSDQKRVTDRRKAVDDGNVYNIIQERQ